MNLAFLIHRIATDEQFAMQFITNPKDALRKSGLTLDTLSLQALSKILQKPTSLKALLKDSETGPNDPGNWALHSLNVTASNERAP